MAGLVGSPGLREQEGLQDGVNKAYGKLQADIAGLGQSRLNYALEGSSVLQVRVEMQE